MSHILQQLAVALWRTPATKRLLARAERAYAERRQALLEALAHHGIAASGCSGLDAGHPPRKRTP